MVSEFLVKLVDFAWGGTLLALLIGGGLYLAIVSRLLPLRGFIHAIKLVMGKYHHKGETHAEGQITHFKALMNALAATVGVGNIGGVAVAITQGGAGAIFWMWVTALIGMNTKFFECTLALMYRGKDYKGEVQGGPMYVIEKALPKPFRFLAIMFSVFGLIGCLAMFNMNQLAEYTNTHLGIDKLLAGIVCAIFVGYTLLGGLKRIANITSSLVPVMCVLYILFCSVILFSNLSLIPEMLSKIVAEAFNFESVGGGIMGYVFMQVMQVGVKRAAFSNEAGIGTAPMAHGNAKTNEPVSEGLVAMLGPFLDTIIVCTMTALVILVSFPDKNFTETSGVLLTLSAFEKNLPGVGGHFLGLAIILFSITTMVGYSNYNSKCWNYLFKGRKLLGDPTYIAFFCGSIVVGAIYSLDDVINLLDTGFAFMAYPNMIATLWLAKNVKTELNSYFRKYKI